MTAAKRAADRIIDEKEILAREITEALYGRMPVLMEKHGERGRVKCFEDMRYNLEHLAPAVHLENPDMFAAYVEWLQQLLLARHVSTEEIAVSLELTREIVEQRFENELAEPVGRVVGAGLRILRRERVS